MNNLAVSSRIIRRLVIDLRALSGVTRKRAREQLVRLGNKVTPFLLPCLKHPKDKVRWEAAKIFIGVQDLRAAPPLITALEDKNIEVQWVAAEALISQGPDVIPLLLNALMTKHDSLLLRHGVHHVLRDLARKRLLPKAVSSVLSSLEGSDVQDSCPVAAERALEAVRKYNPGNRRGQLKRQN